MRRSGGDLEQPHLGPDVGHPILFFLLACAVSWAAWLPLAWAVTSNPGTQPGGLQYLHLIGTLGPLTAAYLVTAWTDGWSGLQELTRRSSRWRVGWQWLRALGGIGSDLLADPATVKERLEGLKTVDWPKKNKDWEGVCVVANSVVSRAAPRKRASRIGRGEQGPAINEARRLAQKHPLSQVIIQNEDGKIEREYTYGKDPRRFPGQRLRSSGV